MVRYVPWKTVGNNDIPELVIVKVSQHGCPAPIGGMNPCIEAYIAENKLSVVGPPPLVQLQDIAYMLEGIFKGFIIEIGYIIIWLKKNFPPEVILGQHVQDKDVCQPVIVHIAYIHPHG